MTEKERFDHYLSLLQSAFPEWSKVHKDRTSIGAQFLSVIGLTFAEIDWLLDYAERQRYIQTADLNQADVIYKAYIPNSLTNKMNFQITGGGYVLEKMEDPIKFLTLYHEPNPVYYKNLCCIDYENKMLYVYHTYDDDRKFPNGHVTLSFRGEDAEVLHEEKLPLHLHHVWNFFDEFGLLLHLPRLYGERNKEYKERILDVFRRPANATKKGLLNGMARELGLATEQVWYDGQYDLILKGDQINFHSLTVDDQPVPLDRIDQKETGEWFLKGDPRNLGKKQVVRFYSGVTIHELHDHSDYAFQRELFDIDGTAKPLLEYYVNIIENQIPTKWGKWRWDEGFWDTSAMEVNGVGYLPSVFDGQFKGWENYQPKEV